MRELSDLKLVAVSILQWILWILFVIQIDQFNLNNSFLSAAFIFALGLSISLLIATQFQTVSHYFIHRPFFKLNLFNRFFSAINSVNIGSPTFLYWAHHQNHHMFSNGPGDLSSTWLNGKNGNEESLIAYSLLSPLRVQYGELLGFAKKKYSYLEMFFETVVFLGVIFVSLFFFTSSFAIFLTATFAVLTVTYLGQVLAAAENYLEHSGTDFNDINRNSVSCYSKWYNQVWFNNGYHQEHHLKPMTHWSALPSIKSLLIDEKLRVVVPRSHWFFWERHRLKANQLTLHGSKE